VTDTFEVEAIAPRLAESLSTVEWAINEIPPEWTHRPLAITPDDWHPAMNLAHLTIYDEYIARPVLEALAEGGDGIGSTRSGMEHWFSQDAIDLSAEPIDAILARFRSARESHIATVRKFSLERFNHPMTPIWSYGGALNSPGWVATKTLQHTWEHGAPILRAALFSPRAG
jgi:hypothetical protein